MTRALAVAAALLAVVAAPAPAQELSGRSARELAARAAEDPAAAQRLREARSIDGRPVDLRRALAGARGGEIAERVGALATAAPGGARVTDARARARAILDRPGFRSPQLPRPFEGPLQWLGRRLEPVRDWVAGAFRAVAARLPGGHAGAYALLGLLVLLAAAAFSRTVIRRRVAAQAQADRPVPRQASAAALERAAAAAEHEQDWARAVRLRFRAGLRRLADAGVVDDRPSLTAQEVSVRLRAPEFDRLRATFDAIAYGARPARREDAETSARLWRDLLAGRR